MSVNKFQVVCSTCSANKAPLKYRNLSTARVCDTCYDIIESGKQRKFLIMLSVQFQVKTIEKNKFVLKASNCSFVVYFYRIVKGWSFSFPIP